MMLVPLLSITVRDPVMRDVAQLYRVHLNTYWLLLLFVRS